MLEFAAAYYAVMEPSRHRCAGLTLCVLLLLPAAAAAEGSQSLAYEVWLGGLRALEADGRIVRQAETYRVTLKARTKGMVGWFYPYELELEAVGARQSAEHRPQQFSSKSRSSDETKTLAIRYAADGTLETRREPASANPDPKALPAEMVRATLDPVSAMLTVMAKASQGAAESASGGASQDASRNEADGGCQGLTRVFDGKRRYNLWARPAGQTTLKASRYNVYSGPVTLCRLTVQPLAGFKKKKRLAGRIPREITLWLAPIGDGGMPLPVRLEGESSFGGLVVHLVGTEHEPQRAER